MDSIKVSIIVPIYNVEPYILSCLQSVANQTMSDGIECILVDDCGKDNSVAIAEEFIKDYKGNIQFSMLHHDRNRGLSEARNTAMRVAKGDYIFFLDSDDEISVDCMAILYSHVVQHKGIDVVEGTCIKEVLDSLHFNGDYTDNRRIIKSYLLTYNGQIISAQRRLVSRELIEQHKLRFTPGIIHEDNMWTFFLAKVVKTMAFSFEDVYYHRYNPNSITNNVNVAKECVAYKMLIETFSANIDPFMQGVQKEFVLENLLTAIGTNYYTSEESKESLINSFIQQNNVIERALLNLYFCTSHKRLKGYVLHALIRIYKLRWCLIKNILLTICPKALHHFYSEAKFWIRFHFFRKGLISEMFRGLLGYNMDWDNPKDINQKINWQKIYGDTSSWSILADKYLVREYVKERVGDHILPKLYGVWNSAEDVDFNSLPRRFVLKTNHGAGTVMLVEEKEKLELTENKKTLGKWLKIRFGYKTVEPHYLNIKPVITAEEFLENHDEYSKSLVDYKVFCLNGMPYCILVCYNRTLGEHTDLSFFDCNWKYLSDIIDGKHKGEGKPDIPKPKCLPEMLEYATKLAKGHPQVRVDFYIVNDMIYFGEMTFTSQGGYMDYISPKYSRKMGDLIKLPIDE